MYSRDTDYIKEYHKKIRDFLYCLKKKDKILGLITYNTDPISVLNKLGINHTIFDIFEHSKSIPRDLFDKNRDNYSNYAHFIMRKDFSNNNVVTLIEYKRDMILRNIQNYDKKDIIFFDDNLSNVLELRAAGVESVLVNPEIGIKIQKI
jgi:FMN phosphatase YigB (HAD superfamily)